jgi:hypothetical protein
VYRHRSELYTLPGILNEVDGHGNDRTIRKLDQLLEKAASGMRFGADARAAKARAKGNKALGGKSSGKVSKATDKAISKATDKGQGQGRKRKSETAVKNQAEAGPQVEDDQAIAGLREAEIRDIKRIKL